MGVSGAQRIWYMIPDRRVGVCVATCGRPVGLGNLLGALEVLEMPAGVTRQVVCG